MQQEGYVYRFLLKNTALVHLPLQAEKAPKFKSEITHPMHISTNRLPTTLFFTTGRNITHLTL